MIRRTLLTLALFAVAACAGGPTAPVAGVAGPGGWIAAPAGSRSVNLGLPGGAVLADGVRFAGGLRIELDPASPLHSLSDIKLTDDAGGFVAVTDAGDLVAGRMRLDARGRLTGAHDWRYQRLTELDGSPIVAKERGDAEGLALMPDGGLLIAFERDHRIWRYGSAAAPGRPVAVPHPDVAFPLNDGMEALSTGPTGWRVGGEDGGVWDCAPAGCRVIQAPPEPLLGDADFRRTGLDRDPAGDGWFVLERSYRPPLDARARVRRMAPDGTVGPVLIELKLPGLTDNFEGLATETRGDRTRLYLLSDDNGNPAQRTLLLAFDVEP